MHVRLAPFAAGRRLRRTRRDPLPGTPPLLLVALTAALLSGACGRPETAEHITVESTLSPNPPVVGPVVLTLRWMDDQGQLVRPRSLRVEAHMSHPGMAPVLADAAERGDGAYEAAFELTMAGDWILLVSGTLPAGGALRHRIDVPAVRSPE